MNEQIRKLAEQAGYNGHYATEEFDVEEFANLIVLGCVGLVNQQLQHNNPNDSLLALKIKEHFGVAQND